MCDNQNQEETNTDILKQGNKKEFDVQVINIYGMDYDAPLATSNNGREMTDTVQCFIKEEKHDEECEQIEAITVKPEILDDMYDPNYSDTEDDKFTIISNLNDTENFVHENDIKFSSSLEDGLRSNNFNKNFVPGKQMTEDEMNVSLKPQEKDVEVYNFKECEESFKVSHNVISHTNTIHNKAKKFSCDMCKNKSFAKRHNLERHISAVHERVKRYTCEECHKQFFMLCELNRHEIAIHRRKTIECEICFKRVSQLYIKSHMRAVHNIVKKHNCEKCDKTFTRLSDLNLHVKAVHQKRFECIKCPLRFSYPYKLNAHIDAVHRNIRKFSCGECKKTFTYMQILKDHIHGIHLGIKNYKCADCSMEFSLPSNLKRHVNEQHKGIKKRHLH